MSRLLTDENVIPIREDVILTSDYVVPIYDHIILTSEILILTYREGMANRCCAIATYTFAIFIVNRHMVPDGHTSWRIFGEPPGVTSRERYHLGHTKCG